MSDYQVAAHASAHHVTVQATELVASIPRSASFQRAFKHRRHACGGSGGGGGGDGNISGVFRVDRDEFSFQRSFLEARAELLQLLGASWGMCQVEYGGAMFRSVEHVTHGKPSQTITQ